MVDELMDGADMIEVPVGEHNRAWFAAFAEPFLGSPDDLAGAHWRQSGVDDRPIAAGGFADEVTVHDQVLQTEHALLGAFPTVAELWS
jgi:hypothetical protein